MFACWCHTGASLILCRDMGVLDAEMDQGAETQKPRTSACCLRKIKLTKVPHQPRSKQLQVKREINNSPKIVVCVGRFFFFLMLVVVYRALPSAHTRVQTPGRGRIGLGRWPSSSREHFPVCVPDQTPAILPYFDW